ncbi:hypothetical protein TcCL_NonESM12560, partial [Trypanosoma cruzi]
GMRVWWCLDHIFRGRTFPCRLRAGRRSVAVHFPRMPPTLIHHASPLTYSVVPHRRYYCSRCDSAYFTHLIVPQCIRSCGRRIQTAVPNTVSGSPHPCMSQRSGA